MTLMINGKKYTVKDQEQSLSLMDYLRENQFLNGVKNGCNKGLCGSCTVIMNDKAVRSCKTKMSDIDEASVITIEGMEKADGTLHPLQQAFMDAGAVQCGFCTPGMIMSAYALLQRNPSPDRQQIRKALQGNLCRCTGYQQIVDAVELASTKMAEPGSFSLAGCLF